jgi:hypothetical protein
MPRSLSLAVPLTLVLFTAACGGDDPTTPTEPTPAPTTVTETFSGTLERNFATTHPFPSGLGTMTATVTALTPESTATIGLALGTWNGQVCDLRVTNDRATQGTVLIAQASVSGAFCLRVSDAAGVSQTTGYTVQVVHP